MERAPPDARTVQGRTRGASVSSSDSSASASRVDASRAATLISVPLLAQPNSPRKAPVGEHGAIPASSSSFASSAEAGPSSRPATALLPTPTSAASHKDIAASSAAASPVSRVNAGARRPRGTYASRTCLQCRQRKAKCKLPEEALRVPSSLEELPLHLRCARCAEHGFGCVVWDPEGRGKRKRGISGVSDAPTAGAATVPTAAALQPDPTIFSTSAPRTTAMLQARGASSSLDFAFAEPSFVDTPEGASQHRSYPDSLRYYIGPQAGTADLRHVAGPSSSAGGAQPPQRHRSTTSASSSRYPMVPVSLGAGERYTQAHVAQQPAHGTAQAASRPQPGAQLDLNAFLDGMTGPATYHPTELPMPSADALRPPAPSPALPQADSQTDASSDQKPDTPLEALSRFLADETACAVSPFRDAGTPAAGGDVLSLISTELSARLEILAHAFILWHPHLPSLRTLRQQHAQSCTISTSLLLASLYALALPELTPTPHGALQLVASLHALIRRDAALLYSGAEASVEAIQALELLSVHMPLALLPCLPHGPSRDMHAFQGTSLAQLAERLARKIGLPGKAHQTRILGRTDPRALLWCTLVAWRETLSGNVELGDEFDDVLNRAGNIAGALDRSLPFPCSLKHDDVPTLQRAGEGLLLLRLKQLQLLRACQRRCEQIFTQEPTITGLNLAMFHPTLSRCSLALTDVRNATLKRLGPLDKADGPVRVLWHSLQLEVEMGRLLLLESILLYSERIHRATHAPTNGSSGYAQDRLALREHLIDDPHSDEIRDMQASTVWGGLARFNSLLHAALDEWSHLKPSAVVALPVLSTCSFLQYAARCAVSLRLHAHKAETGFQGHDSSEQASVLQLAARHARACDGFARRNEHGGARASAERGSIWSATAQALDQAADALSDWSFGTGRGAAQSRISAGGPSSDFRQELGSSSGLAAYDALSSAPHASHMSELGGGPTPLSVSDVQRFARPDGNMDSELTRRDWQSGMPQAAFATATPDWPEVWNLGEPTTHLGAGAMGTPLALQQPHYQLPQRQPQAHQHTQLLQPAHRHHQQFANSRTYSDGPDISQELALTPDAQLAQQQAGRIAPHHAHAHAPRSGGGVSGDRWIPTPD